MAPRAESTDGTWMRARTDARQLFASSRTTRQSGIHALYDYEAPARLCDDVEQVLLRAEAPALRHFQERHEFSHAGDRGFFERHGNAFWAVATSVLHAQGLPQAIAHKP